MQLQFKNYKYSYVHIIKIYMNKLGALGIYFILIPEGNQVSVFEY